MSQVTTLERLTKMAERFQRYFRNQGLAETSFITSARFRGFPAEMIKNVATLFWPEGPSTRYATSNGA